MIQTNGLLSDSGVVKQFPAGASNFLFPIGSDVDYMPVNYNITANGSAGSIRLLPVKSQHPATTDALNLEFTGFMALRKAWLMSTALLLNPFARAVLIKSCESTSKNELRANCTTTDKGLMPSVKAGKIIFFNCMVLPSPKSSIVYKLPVMLRPV